MSVRVRFAPSPTGMLHIGGLRTALYNYLLARKMGGTFILRIEDTDQSRFVECAEEDIKWGMVWAGLVYDEGPDVGGPFGPYYQSQRSALYAKYVEQLLAQGDAYYAFDTKEEIEAQREALTAQGHPAPKYDYHTRQEMRNSLTLPNAEVQRRLAAGEPYVVRLKVTPGQEIVFEDAIRGQVSFMSDELDDQVLLKSDGLPTYHLANVVDDHMMGITQVIRGEEWLSSTPKHMLLYQALGWTPPLMAHLPLILSPNGGKLSKRSAERLGIPVNVRQYREAGYEPEAVVNFLAFLGWNPGTEQEVYSLDALVDAFSLDRVGASGVQFSMDKLNWFNAEHLRRLSPAALAARARPAIYAAGFSPEPDYLEQAAALMQERISLAGELATKGAYLFTDPATYDEKAVSKRWKADTGALLAAYAERIAGDLAFTSEALEADLKAFVAQQGLGLGRLMAPLRLALTGVLGGPGLFEMMVLLGRATCVRRIECAVAVLG